MIYEFISVSRSLLLPPTLFDGKIWFWFLSLFHVFSFLLLNCESQRLCGKSYSSISPWDSVSETKNINEEEEETEKYSKMRKEEETETFTDYCVFFIFRIERGTFDVRWKRSFFLFVIHSIFRFLFLFFSISFISIHFYNLILLVHRLKSIGNKAFTDHRTEKKLQEFAENVSWIFYLFVYEGIKIKNKWNQKTYIRIMRNYI